MILLPRHVNYRLDPASCSRGWKIAQVGAVRLARMPRSRSRSACPNCGLFDWCPAANLDVIEGDVFGDFAGRQQPIKRAKYLYRAGSVVRFLYVIRSGSMKTIDASGRVTGFFIAGDLVGVGAVNEGIYLCNAVALENGMVCGISMDRIEDITRRVPALRRHFYQILSREMARAYDIALLYDGKRADQCLATFLIALSKRYAARGYSATDFKLHLVPEDIASHIGVTPEIVNLVFSRFQDVQLIAKRNEAINIKNLAALQRIAGDPPMHRFTLDCENAAAVEADGYTGPRSLCDQHRHCATRSMTRARGRETWGLGLSGNRGSY